MPFSLGYIPTPRWEGGGRTCPLLDFLNNSKTVAYIFADVFVGSLHANFDQNRLNVKTFAKNRVLKETTQSPVYMYNDTLYKMAS